jgi:hypothetical protein
MPPENMSPLRPNIPSQFSRLQWIARLTATKESAARNGCMEAVAGPFVLACWLGMLASIPIALGWMRRWGITRKSDACMVGGASFTGLLLMSFLLPDSATRATETGAGIVALAAPSATLDNIRIEQVMWEKTGLDNVMIATFRIDNDNVIRIKNVEVTCRHSTDSGTFIDSNTRTVHEIIEPRSSFYVHGMTMGLIHSQATSTQCKATDFTD